MNISYEGKTVIVTGAAGGLGKAMSRLFAECGAKVAVCDIAGGEAITEEINNAGGTAKYYRFDIRDREQIEKAFAGIKNDFGSIDVLVNNAGINGGPEERKTVEFYSDGLWDKIISIDLDGVYKCSKAAIPYMQNGGAILNISSVVGVVPLRNQCGFAAAKAGVVNLTKAMAIEMAPKKIRVNCICPGTIGITITNTLWTDDSAMKGLLAHIPLGRQAVPDEIAAPTVFVCSDYASYMTGAVITVDGGWTAGGYARNF